MAHPIRPVLPSPLPPGLAGATRVPAAPAGASEPVPLEAVLELLPIGVMLLEPTPGGFRIRAGNAQAKTLLEAGDGLSLARGCVVAANAALDERVQRLFRETLGRVDGGGGPLRLDIPLASGGRLGLHARAVGRGPSLVCLSISSQRPAAPAVFDGLSPRRREVLEALIAGERPHAIARSLGLSEHTVRAYVKDLHRHFGAHSRGELLARFIPPTSH